MLEASVRERQSDGAGDGPAAARDADKTLHGAQPPLDKLARAVDGVHEHRQRVHRLIPLGRVRGVGAYQIRAKRVSRFSSRAPVVLVLVFLTDDAQTGPRRAQRVHDGHLRVGVRLGERRARVVRVLARGRQRARARAALLHGADLVAALQRGVHARRQQLAHGDELRGCRGCRDDGHRGGSGRDAGTGRAAGQTAERVGEGRGNAGRVCARDTRAHQVESMRGPSVRPRVDRFPRCDRNFYFRQRGRHTGSRKPARTLKANRGGRSANAKSVPTRQ